MSLKKKIFGVLVLGAGVFAAAATAVAGVNEYRLGVMSGADEESRAQDLRLDDAFGGRTPAETLLQFADAVVLRSPDAVRFAVPALRGALGARLQGLEPSELLEIVGLLREASQAAPDRVLESSVTIASPVFVELVRYPSGVWKIVAF